jgi:hypothetical protein
MEHQRAAFRREPACECRDDRRAAGDDQVGLGAHGVGHLGLDA